jgi:hypothetical protein
MRELDEQIQKFMKSYIILKDYLLEAAHRLETMATTTSDVSSVMLSLRF